MSNVFLNLQKIINSVEDSHINYTIALYLVEVMKLPSSEISKLNIEDIANNCYTSISTVSRFAKYLGFSSFQKFKEKMIQSKTLSSQFMNDNRQYLNDKSQNLEVENYVENIHQWLLEMNKSIDIKEIDLLSKNINRCQRLIICGTHLANYLAEYLQFILMYSGKKVLIFNDVSEEILDHYELSSSDYCMIFSLGGNYISRHLFLTTYLRENNIPTTLVTQLSETMRFDFAQIIRLGSYDNEKCGRYRLLLFIDILINRLC